MQLLQTLVAAKSVTPEDAGCQALMIERLSKLDFKIEQLEFADKKGRVQNFWARRGSASPLFVFAGHTDVVPVGNIEQWQSDPFTLTERDGHLYGRGSADMKTSLAAFITSIEAFVEEHPDHAGSIALLITSDEEGPATCGTRRVMQVLQERDENIDYCLVGEPSSSDTLGDVIKNGRRGSLGAELTIIGTQGHVAYPQLADNPIHYCGDVIQSLSAIEWDQGNQYFPPTSFQISNINGGTGATNVIPENVKLVFNYRFSTETSAEEIEQRVTQCLNEMEIKYELEWTLFGLPFLTEEAELVKACRQAIFDTQAIETQLSTSGGTSDGRFIAPSGAQVVELGPINATIHKIDECVPADTPDQLCNLYRAVLENILHTSPAKK